MLVSKKHVDEKLAKACVLYTKRDADDIDRLYKDAECTQMVTYSEFKEFAFLGLVLFVHDEYIGDHYTWPWRVHLWGDDEWSGYGEVTTIMFELGEYKMGSFYTAEYEREGE